MLHDMRGSHGSLSRANFELACCIFVFLATSQFTFRLGIQPFMLVLVYAGCLAYILMRPGILRSAGLVLLAPVVALILSVWSVNIGLSAYRSFQLLMTTFMGIVIAHHVAPHRAMIAICLCELAITGLSVLNAVFPFLAPAFYNGEFIGVMTHKNHLAHAVIFAGAGCLALGYYWRVPGLGFAAAIALFPVLERAESAGGKVLYALLICLVVLFWLRHVPPAIRVRWIWGAMILVMIGVIGLCTIWSGWIAMGLEALGKDSTLTGRTVLWKFGLDHAVTHPLTGYGFQAFWSEPSYTRDYLRTYVDPRTSIFHNGYIEIVVALGLIGGGACIVAFFAGFYRAARWYCRDATVTSAFFLFAILFMAVASLVEPLLFGVHSFNHIMVVMSVCYAMRRDPNQMRISRQVPSRSDDPVRKGA